MERKWEDLSTGERIERLKEMVDALIAIHSTDMSRLKHDVHHLKDRMQKLDGLSQMSGGVPLRTGSSRS